MAEPDNLRVTGDRIASLLEQLQSSADRVVAERALEALQLVTELYGAALARVVALADRVLLQRLATDDLVASLLVIHGLHPETLAERVGAALERVRPYLGSHGGDVELLGVAEGRVRLRMLGSCDGCPSSSVTLKLAVEQAVLAAAPEVEGIDVEGADVELATPLGSGPIGQPRPASPAVAVRLGPKPAGRDTGAPRNGDGDGEVGAWAVVHGLAGLPPGRVRVLDLGGRPLVVCRVGAALYAYQDACPVCRSGLATATLTGEVLRCGACGAAFDVRLAGRSLDGTAAHLDPQPLLEDEGGVRIATAAGVWR